ncbi:hypothetical protein MMC25_000150 [Agyrium rufum]|nr:hypothetical protein [Agyrium rufum]
MAESDDEEEDYMSMAIQEPSKPAEKETYTQRRIRKQREAEANGRSKSKAEIASEAQAARDAALATALPADNKGYKMMAKLGFKQGSTLGATTNANARTEPLELLVKEGRSGVGMDSERKRKFREEVEGEAKRVKAEEGDYRERVAREREDKRCEGLVHGAMRVLEGFEGDGGDEGERADRRDQSAVNANEKHTDNVTHTSSGRGSKPKLVKSVNVLWRGLLRERLEKEKKRRARHDLLQSLSKNANYDDSEEDAQDRQAWGTEVEELDEEDPELDEFNALEPKERLDKLVGYLRSQYYYCFWCKFRYDDEILDGCPGLTEDDHG